MIMFTNPIQFFLLYNRLKKSRCLKIIKIDRKERTYFVGRTQFHSPGADNELFSINTWFAFPSKMILEPLIPIIFIK